MVFGIGINDANYSIHRWKYLDGKLVKIWTCPYYSRWVNLLRRCYSDKYLEKYPTYVGCKVCEEWLTFSNFKSWMEKQDWEGKQLDKDFLVEGNKIYSPETCVFLPQSLNKFIVTRGGLRGDYPLGVSYMKKNKDMVNEHNSPYRSEINNQTGKTLHLGMYSSPEAAHQRYLKEKLKQCEKYLEDFKDDPTICSGLIRIRYKIEYHIDHKLELTSF